MIYLILTITLMYLNVNGYRCKKRIIIISPLDVQLEIHNSWVIVIYLLLAIMLAIGKCLNE